MDFASFMASWDFPEAVGPKIIMGGTLLKLAAVIFHIPKAGGAIGISLRYWSVALFAPIFKYLFYGVYYSQKNPKPKTDKGSY